MTYVVTVSQFADGRWFVKVQFRSGRSDERVCPTRVAAELFIGDKIMSDAADIAEAEARR